MQNRTTQEVLEDHLDLAQDNDVDTDIDRNFDPDCVLMTSFGDFCGHAGVREAAELLARQIGPAKYDCTNQRWHEELAFLEWKADTDKASISDGADSYWIRNGRIRAMTIHYSVQDK